MDKNIIRDNILRSLYRRYEEQSGYSAAMAGELAEELGVPIETIDQCVIFLSDAGFLKEGGSHSCELTTKGVLYADGPSPFNSLTAYHGQIVEIRDGASANIIQAGGNIVGTTQSQGVSPEVLLGCLAHRLETAEHIPVVKRRGWMTTLREVMLEPALKEVFRAVADSLSGKIFP